MKLKMLNLIRSIYKIIEKLLSFIITYNLYKRMKNFKAKVIWYSLERKFKSVGKNCFIEENEVILNPQNIVLGDNFYALADFRMEAYEEFQSEKYYPQISIGNNVSFGYRCHVGCVNEINVGNNTLFGSNIFITDHFHGNTISEDLSIPVVKRKLYTKGPVNIGDNVWIGDNVTIMPNVTIGNNSIIGANSVITHDIPPNSIAAGVPARIIRKIMDKNTKANN